LRVTPGWRPAGRLAWRAAPWLLAAAVLMFVAQLGRSLDWQEVWKVLTSQSPARLALALALTVASHLLYASFDLIGRWLTRMRLSLPRTLAVAAVSYAVNLNFGALLGGFALRLRLYLRQGVRPAVAAKIIGHTIVTNWLGYAWITGIMLWVTPLKLPPAWPLASIGLRGLGVTLFAGALLWIGACAWLGPRRITVRGHEIELPGLRAALWQASAGGANWMLMGAVCWVVLQDHASYPAVLSGLLLAAVAGAVSHIPGGLGVMEAVFVAVLAGELPHAELLGALLTYRVIHNVVSLTWALAGYAVLESLSGRDEAPAQVLTD
jgi:uncharacterized membrane protein YbhN (UPF0104 family)